MARVRAARHAWVERVPWAKELVPGGDSHGVWAMAASRGVLLVLALAAVGTAGAALPGPGSRLDPRDRAERTLALRYAPVVYQDVAHNRGRSADLPMRLDFDGNRRAADNWEHLDDLRRGRPSARGYDARCAIYYAVVSTPSHHFITYALFYPQDWDDHWLAYVRGRRSHENDLEPLVVCVRRSTGRVDALYVQAHGRWRIYDGGGELAPAEGAVEGPARILGWSHPAIFAEAKGHGLYGHGYLGQPGQDFPGGDGYVLVAGERGEVARARNPRDLGRRTVRYSLVPIRRTLWAWRHEVGPDRLWRDRMVYRGRRHALDERFGYNLVGDDGKDDAAHAPWGQTDEAETGLARGETFFDPAGVLSRRVRFRGGIDPDYEWNPYLGIGGH